MLVLVSVGRVVFTGVQKVVLIHYGQYQIIISVRVFKRCILLSSSFVHISRCVTIVSILVNLRLIIFYQHTKKNSYGLQPRSQIIKSVLEPKLYCFWRNGEILYSLKKKE